MFYKLTLQFKLRFTVKYIGPNILSRDLLNSLYPGISWKQKWVREFFGKKEAERRDREHEKNSSRRQCL